MITRTDWLHQCGCPPSELEALSADSGQIRSRLSLVRPELDLTDHDVVPGTDGGLLALHTPGHTPGHLCFRDLSRNLLFTGDHVLPRVSPNVSRRPDTDQDPLADYAHSLRRMHDYQDALVLPGHEWSFDRIGDRVSVLLEHHEQRLDEVESTVRAGAETTWEITTQITWHRPFGPLEPRAAVRDRRGRFASDAARRPRSNQA